MLLERLSPDDVYRHVTFDGLRALFAVHRSDKAAAKDALAKEALTREALADVA